MPTESKASVLDQQTTLPKPNKMKKGADEPKQHVEKEPVSTSQSNPISTSAAVEVLETDSIDNEPTSSFQENNDGKRSYGPSLPANVALPSTPGKYLILRSI